MFIWRVETILAEIERQMPDLFKAVSEIATAWNTPNRDEVLRTHWNDLKSQTIDYGVMEKAEKVAVLPAGGLGWSDVGSWDSLFEVLFPDMNGNKTSNNESHEPTSLQPRPPAGNTATFSAFSITP